MVSVWEIIGDVGYIAVYSAAFQKEMAKLRMLVIAATVLFMFQDIYFQFWSNVVLALGYIGIHMSSEYHGPARAPLRTRPPLRRA